MYLQLTVGVSETHLVTGDSEIVAAVIQYGSIKFTGQKTTGQPRQGCFSQVLDDIRKAGKGWHKIKWEILW
jgi:hypothetical protein